MDTKADLQAKLAYLNAKWSEGTESMSAEEKQRHLDMLQEVLTAMGSMQKDLKKSVAESNPDACVIRACGDFPRAVDGSFIYPPRIDIQEGIIRYYRERNEGKAPPAIEIVATFAEVNFNYIRNGQTHPKFLFREEEFFVKFATPDQAEFVIKSNLCFWIPGRQIFLVESAQKSSTREA